MILDTLRATLIVGTVMVNAIQLGRPAEPVGTAPTEPLTTAPLSREVSPTPITSLMTSAPPAAAKIPRLLSIKGVEASLAKLKHVRSGFATWYGMVLDNHRTASGERFDSRLLTAASNTLPLGTTVKVTNLRNGRSVVVRINDRGILNPGRVIDVSSAAAEKIGLLRMGVAPVHLDVLAMAS